MNIKNAATGLFLAAGMSLPLQSYAEERSVLPQAKEGEHIDQHAHYNHLVLSVEAQRHVMLSHILYTRHLVKNVSLGASVGLGADHNGNLAGGVEAVLAYHKTIRKPIFGVAEVAGGAEFIGSHISPIAKLTGLVGVQLNDVLGVSVGPSIIVAKNDIQPAASAHLAVSF